MSGSNTNNQKAFYFFTDGWNIDVDNLLINVLLDMHENGHRFIRSPTRKLLNSIIERVGAMSHSVYPRSTYKEQIKKLRLRVNCFDYIISQKGVTWDRKRNFVDTTVEKWDALKKVYPCAVAYMQESELWWEKLMVIFSTDVEGALPQEKGVIVLDSEDDDTPPSKRGKYIISDNEGETQLNPIQVDRNIHLSPAMVQHRQDMKIITKGLTKNLFDCGSSNFCKEVGDVGPTVGEKIESREKGPTDSGDQLSSTASSPPFQGQK